MLRLVVGLEGRRIRAERSLYRQEGSRRGLFVSERYLSSSSAELAPEESAACGLYA